MKRQDIENQGGEISLKKFVGRVAGLTAAFIVFLELHAMCMQNHRFTRIYW